jgi:hypothetical protein
MTRKLIVVIGAGLILLANALFLLLVVASEIIHNWKKGRGW